MEIKNIATYVLSNVVRSVIGGNLVIEILNTLNKSDKLTDEKIEKAYLSLKTTSTLINELQADLEQKKEIIIKLKKDYEHYSKLSLIEKENIEPMLKELTKTINKGKGRERFISFAISIIAGLILFGLGFWLSPIITNFMQ